MGFFDKLKGKTKENLLKYLQNNISSKMTLEDIVYVFEKMCSMPIKDDMILFETGTYSFTGKPMFYFSLVRQFPNNEEEYYQLHVDILYNPSDENKSFEQTTWNEDIDENIFEYVRNTQAFAFCKNTEYNKVDIYLDET